MIEPAADTSSDAVSDGAIRVRRALISVSDKTGIADFAKGLAAAGVEILSTGGTATALREAGVEVTDVSELHRPGGDPRRPRQDPPPAAARGAARAARRARSTWRPWSARGSSRSTWSASTSTRSRRRSPADEVDPELAIENIDIGGPTMIRAAAKNHDSVAVIVKPESYDAVFAELEESGGEISALDPALAGQRGLRPDRPLRRGDQPLVLDLLRGLPRAPRGRLREGARPLLRREPAPARGALPRGGHPHPRALARSPRSTAARSPSTTSSTSTPPAAWSKTSPSRPARSSSTTTPAGSRSATTRWRPIGRRSPATRCPPSAA